MDKFLKRFLLTATIGVTILMASCGDSVKDQNSISGVVNVSQNGQLLLWELSSKKANIIDSVNLGADGSFSFNPKPHGKTFYRITNNEQEGILLLMDSTENANLTINADQFATDYTVEGSEDSKILIDLGRIINSAMESRDSLQDVYRESMPNMTEEIMSNLQNRMMAIDKELNASIEQFIRNNMNSLAVLATIETLDLDKHFELYKEIDENIGELYPNSQYYQAFHQKFEYSSKFTPGREVPDITLPNTNGELTSLSSLRGKYVLIDFWASWCKPCRAENPNVVKLYNKYKGPNFEIFGVSLDQQKEAWLAAIEKDGLDWMHVSDLKLWQSPVVQLYDIKGIPLTILINPEGKIVAKNLRGEDLANKLEEIFSES